MPSFANSAHLPLQPHPKKAAAVLTKFAKFADGDVHEVEFQIHFDVVIGSPTFANMGMSASRRRSSLLFCSLLTVLQLPCCKSLQSILLFVARFITALQCV